LLPCLTEGRFASRQRRERNSSSRTYNSGRRRSEDLQALIPAHRQAGFGSFVSRQKNKNNSFEVT
jgi:hypothetical protein